MKHVVLIFFNAHDWTNANDEAWTKTRHDFFLRYTHRSLLAQTFKDFDIWLICGEKHREFVSSLLWPVNIKLICDRGQSELRKIEDDYLVISRIDSDDLYRSNALEAIHKWAMRNRTNETEYLIFRKNLYWDQVNEFIGYRYRTAPPYWTHIHPKNLYKNWDYFEKTTYVQHARAGGRLPQAVELPKHHVCIIIHPLNSIRHCQGLPPVQYSQAELAGFIGEGRILTRDKKAMRGILEDFGIKE